jgi:proteasome assembly chaperone 2
MAQLSRTPTYHLLPANTKPEQAERTNTEFDLRSIPPFELDTPAPSHDIDRRTSGTQLPGTGLTSRILNSDIMASPSASPCVAILQFVMEGDNRADAHLLARRALQALKVGSQFVSDSSCTRFVSNFLIA